MIDDDSDYQLVPKKDFEKLKKEVAYLKKNPYSESDSGRDLQQSIERLNNTINKLISILEDAQQDIIDEYQESKPIEKLNQILDQNETIAKALVSINDKLSGSDDSNPLPIPDVGPVVVQNPQIPRPGFDLASANVRGVQQSFNQQPGNQFISNQQQIKQKSVEQSLANSQNVVQQPNQFQNISSPQSMTQTMQRPPSSQQVNSQQFSPQQFNTQQQPFSPLPPLDSIDSIPPLEGLDTQQMNSGILPEKKKKFLGLIG